MISANGFRVGSNPSLKRSANGRPPGPVWRCAVHFRQPGLPHPSLCHSNCEELGHQRPKFNRLGHILNYGRMLWIAPLCRCELCGRVGSGVV
jgi:hypothetical protein